MVNNNVIIILEPLDALEIYALLEVIEEKFKPTNALGSAITNYKKNIDNNLTTDQLNDAESAREVRKLLGNYE